MLRLPKIAFSEAARGPEGSPGRRESFSGPRTVGRITKTFAVTSPAETAYDFHTHLALAGQGRPSVILLPIEGIGAAAQAELIAAVCRSCEAALTDGAAVSADGNSVRIRRLPLR